MTVAASQLPKLFGVEDDPHATGFFHILWSVLRHIGQVNIPTVLLSIVTITLLLLIGKFAPLVPGPLVVVVLGIVLAAFGGLPSMGVALIPEVPQEFRCRHCPPSTMSDNSSRARWLSR